MTQPIAPDPRFHAWLAARAPQRAPDGLLRRAMEEVDRVAQERRWSRRWPALRFATPAAAAAAVIVLAVGTALVVTNVQGPIAGPIATVAPSTTPTPSPTPVPTPMNAAWIAGPTVCIDKAEGFKVGVPRGWYANAAAPEIPACRLFSVDTVEIADANDPPNVPIRLSVATGDVGFAGEDVVDRGELTIAGLPALRFLTKGLNGLHLTYVIGLDGTLPFENSPDRFLLITTTSGDETFERDSAALEELAGQFAVIGG